MLVEIQTWFSLKCTCVLNTTVWEIGKHKGDFQRFAMFLFLIMTAAGAKVKVRRRLPSPQFFSQIYWYLSELLMPPSVSIPWKDWWSSSSNLWTKSHLCALSQWQNSGRCITPRTGRKVPNQIMIHCLSNNTSDISPNNKQIKTWIVIYVFPVEVSVLSISTYFREAVCLQKS